MASEPIAIALEDPGQPDIAALLEAAVAFSDALYPPESNHHLPAGALRAPDIKFHVARDAAGRALGTGAIALKGDWAEVKAMWVVPDARGRGIARTLLSALEAAARDAGVRLMRLETGVYSDAALGLYARAGFTDCAPFDEYRPDPMSVFLEKRLGPL